MDDDDGPTIYIMIVDELPECSNPYCDNKAIGCIEHPVLGVVAICGECLELLGRVSKKMAAAQFN